MAAQIRVRGGEIHRSPIETNGVGSDGSSRSTSTSIKVSGASESCTTNAVGTATLSSTPSHTIVNPTSLNN